MISNQKVAVLDPQLRNCGLRFKVSPNSPRVRTVYVCEDHSLYCRPMLDNPHGKCNWCGIKLVKKLTSVIEPSNEEVVALHDGEGGYVKGLATYLVTEDLVVKPMTFDSCYHLIRFEDIEEKVVDVSLLECKKLLEASLRSKTALTDTFLPELMN